MKWLQREGTSGNKIPMMLLMVAGIIEFLFITMESQFSGIGYYLAENYVIVPCLLLLGYVLREKQSAFGRRRLFLAAAAVCWFVAVQCLHTLSGMENHPMATVFFVYLMAFPFAALTDDRESAGLQRIGGMFVAASLVLVFYTVLLLLDRVPAGMEAYLFWDGARLHSLWHPNIAASYFMIGIGFSVVFCCLTENKWKRALLILAIVLQMLAMAMTNCRTTLLLTGAMLGGTLFFVICKDNWKNVAFGLLVAAAVLAGFFKVSGALYQWNNDRLIAVMTSSQAEPEPDAEVSATEAVQTESTEDTSVTEVTEETSETETTTKEPTLIKNTGILIGMNEQNTLSHDMRTLNGRTLIWKSACKAIRNDKKMALWGTEYPGTVITVYNPFPVVHAHNSWMEAMMRMGIPGLLMSLVFTVLSVWNAAKLIFSRKTLLWKRIVAILTMCVMATGFLEPYLFITNVYYHVTDFAFFFLTGYLDFWSNRKT